MPTTKRPELKDRDVLLLSDLVDAARAIARSANDGPVQKVLHGLEWDRDRLIRECKSLENHLASLSAKSDELERDSEELHELRTKHAELKSRSEALQRLADDIGNKLNAGLAHLPDLRQARDALLGDGPLSPAERDHARKAMDVAIRALCLHPRVVNGTCASCGGTAVDVEDRL